MNIHSFSRKKSAREKISMVTCYDHWSAKILNDTDVDCILVGDSLAVVVHGFDSTVHATIEMMELHVAAVRRGAPDKFIVADMPFLSCSKGVQHAMENVHRLMRAGANAVKIEGDTHQVPVIQHIVESGVPVMGHLGLTPQSIHNLGGHKVQGKDEKRASVITDAARALRGGWLFRDRAGVRAGQTRQLHHAQRAGADHRHRRWSAHGRPGAGAPGSPWRRSRIQAEVPAALCQYP